MEFLRLESFCLSDAGDKRIHKGLAERRIQIAHLGQQKSTSSLHGKLTHYYKLTLRLWWVSARNEVLGY